MRTLGRLAGVAAVLLLALVGAALVLTGYHEQLHTFLPPTVDSEAPELPAELGRPALLVFSKTNAWRHHEGIPAAEKALRELAEGRGWSIFATENAAVFAPANLDRFDVVVWSSATRPALTVEQRAALRDFLENGGGFVAIHAAGDSSHAEWPWYLEEVIRAEFTMHPVRSHIQNARLEVEDPGHPATAALPRVWERADEWYSFAASPRGRGVRVLVTLDEDSYDPEDWAMGDDHPIAWCHSVGKGRVFYSAMGHTPESYAEPRFRAFLEGAIGWAGRLDARGPGSGP